MKIKPLDIVRTEKGSIALVTETNDMGASISIDFIWRAIGTAERNAWWEPHELETVDSLPHLIARNMYHPFGRGKKDIDALFD